MARAQDHRADLGEVVAAEQAGLHVRFDHAARQVVAGCRLLGVDQPPEVGGERTRLLERLRRRLREPVPPHRAVDDEAVILVGRADQLGHHERRKLDRERGRQVGGRPVRDELVDHAFRDRRDPRLEREHPPHAELAGEHAPVAVVRRVVHADERALVAVDGDARLGDGRKVGMRHRAAEAAVVRQHRADLLVARHQPRAPAVPERHCDRAARPRARGRRATAGRTGIRAGTESAARRAATVPRRLRSIREDGSRRR